MNTTQFVIDMKPLTVSKAWQGRRFKTPMYKKWETDVQYFIPRKKYKGKVDVTIELFIKNDKMMDVDNVLKTLLDSMKKSGIYEDDRFIYALHVHKEHSKKEYIRVTIAPY
jgi:Holliday junction resolvase RusA-like endonuclease